MKWKQLLVFTGPAPHSFLRLICIVFLFLTGCYWIAASVEAQDLAYAGPMAPNAATAGSGDSQSAGGSALAGLSGVYTIGGASPDYATFTAALGDLTTLGVDGPVVFNVRNGTYSEQLTIPPIGGASAVNTIVFESESGDSTTVTLTFSSGSPAAPWTLRLSDADYITFRKMTIEATGASFAQAVQLNGDAQYNRFLNNILRSPVASSPSTDMAVAYCVLGDNRNTVFRNNQFENGSTGLYFSGNSEVIINFNGNLLPTYSADVAVESNRFMGQFHRGIYMEYVERAKIRTNSISSGSGFPAYAGLTVAEAIDSTEISSNRIFSLPVHGDGMILESVNAASATPAVVANNFVEVHGAMSHQGISCSYGSYIRFLHNTVRVLDNNFFGAFYVLSSDSITVRNNIFSNSGGGFSFFKDGYGAVSSDYNDLYSTGAPLGFWEGMPAPNLNAWQMLPFGLDSNSLSLDPQFASPGLYRPRAIELKGGGTPAPPVVKDIEGELRDSMHPDIGADEFMPDTLDASVPAFFSPGRPAPAGDTPVRVLLKNNGLLTITSASLYLKVNAGPPVMTAWSGALPSGDTVLVDLDTIFLMPGSTYDLLAWVKMPNGAPDPNAANDTTKVLGLLPALSGVYTIGGMAPDFPAFGPAVGTLVSAGVSGPVTFNVRNGTYIEQITLVEIPGADSTRRVVFQSELGDSSLVVLAFSSFDFGMPWTLRLNGADYCTFRKMTIDATGPFAAQAVQLTGDAQYNNFNHNILRSTPATSTSPLRAVVFCTGGVNRSAVFRNNRVVNGSTGLWFEGVFNNGDYVPGIAVDSNRFLNQFERAAYLTNVNTAQIRSNTVSSTSLYGAYTGLRVLDGAGPLVLSGNRIADVSPNATGLYLGNWATVANAPALVTNNFVETTGTLPANGISCSNGSYVRFLHNTVRVRNTNASSAALYLPIGDSITVRNNILCNTGGGYAIDRNAGSTSDYNDLVTSGANLARLSGTNLPDLDAWRLATAQDSNSLSLDPQFASVGVYRPHAIELNGSAAPEPLVPLDIEGEARDSQNPDIGADEFTPDSVDAAVTAFIGLEPPVPAGSTPVRVRLLNNGLNPLTSVQLYLKINNAAPALTNWSGTLASGDTAVVTLDTIDLTGTQSYDLQAWSAMPNGTADLFPTNDTAIVLNLWPALSGVYTIGGTTPDFPSFNDAVDALQQGGVSGPVTFHARAGTYTEQITLGEIPGADSTRQVVFQSETGDSSSVVLQFNATSASNFTIRLAGTDWITFRQMTIGGLNTSYNRIVVLDNGAHHVTLANNILQGTSSAASSSNRALVYVTNSTSVNHLHISNNRLLNGAYGVYYFGSNAANALGTQISGNRMEGQYTQSIYLYYNADPVIENNSIEPAVYNSSFTGIGVFEAYSSPRITGNKIFSTSDGYGINAQNISGTDSIPVIIANNYIRLGSGASSDYGIHVFNGQQVKILYNTIRIDGTYSGSAALYLGTMPAGDVSNNICANFGSGYALRFTSTPVDTMLYIDHNNLYTTGPVLVFPNGEYATLTDWKNAGYGFDEHSLSLDPLFYDTDDFRVGESALNGAGTPSPFVDTDIEDQARDAQNPDIGADEFSLAMADAGIARIVAPVAPFPAGMQTMHAVLKNHGSAALTAVDIDWTVNGVAQTTVPWTGSLASGAEQTVALGSVDFTVGQVLSVQAWTTDPNGMTDNIPANDTARLNNLHPGLGGVYTIGGVSPDFATFNEAATALKNGGVIDAVMFHVRDGVYTEQLALTSVLGAGASQTISFQSESVDSTAVALQYSSTSSSLNYVVQLNGADWFRFSNMTIQALGTSYARAVALQGGSNNNVFENNRLISASTTVGSDTRAIVFSPFGSRDTANIFRNNHFLNGSDGIYYYGTSIASEYETGTIVRNNRFEDQYQRAINLVYQDAPVIDGNIVTSNTTNASYTGIFASSCTNNLRIENNALTLSKATLGIGIDNCTGTDTLRGLVANNFVQAGGTALASGILFTNAVYQNAYFNSVHINSSNTGSAAFNLLGGSNLRLFNNIAYNSTNGYALQRNATTNIAASDNNDLYTTGSNLVYNANFSTFFASLAAWQTATGFDANSISADPQFTSSTDLHTTNILLDGLALPFAEVPDDIDGQLRNTTGPDIGADEFASVPNDAGVLSIDYPKKIFAAGNQPVQVTMFNNGLDTLYFATIEWMVNGVLQPPFAWSGELLSGSELDSLSIGNFIFEVDTAYAIVAWTTAPNGQSDGDMSNDTAQVSGLHAALAGIYTIGGADPDFLSFTQAVQAMQEGGVAGAVVFNVRDGTYTEQLTIAEIMGASAANTITFQSESGDSTAVILTYSASAAANFTIYLNGADWFRFKRLHIRATNASYGRAVYIQNGANGNTFEGNIISTDINATVPLVYSPGTNDNNTEFRQNRFQNGYYGLYLSGINALPPYETGTKILDNTFEQPQQHGIYLLRQSGAIVSGNTIEMTTGDGIFLYFCNNSSIIGENKIYLQNGYGIYMTDCDNTLDNESLVANNFIATGNHQNNAAIGIYVYSSDRNKFYHNSVLNTSTSTTSQAFYNAGSSNSLVLRNNIFCASGAGLAINNQNGPNFDCDYNDLFTNGAYVGQWLGANAADLTAWQTLSSQDAHTLSIDPLFVSDTDLHVEEVELDKAGAAVAGVTTDIDGEARHAQSPDIGADEFLPFRTHDIGVVELQHPNKTTPFAAGNQPVLAVIKNSGADTITSATIRWWVNNSQQTFYAWTGALEPGERDTVQLGMFDFPVGFGHDFVLYTENPNGQQDLNPENDTFFISDVYAGLSGPYTIGGVLPDFASFTQATTSLNKGGVLGPVMFNVRSGLYTERIVINSIPGSSIANTVTFQSESGDSSSVTLKSGAGDYVVLLNGADHITFKHLTLENTSYASYSDVIELRNSASFNTFSNNRLISVPLFGALIRGDYTFSLDSSTTIKNNYAYAGNYGVLFSGNNTASLEPGLLIENNQFENQYKPILLTYESGPVVLKNTIVSTGEALVLEYCTSASVQQNKISTVDGTGIGLLNCTGTTGNRTLVANNFVHVSGAFNRPGISTYSGNNQNFYYNSVNLTNTNANSAAFYQYYGSDKFLLNNVFVNSGGGYATYVQYATALAVSDFNDLYKTGPYLSYWDGTNVSNLPALQTLSGKENNSVSVNPLFLSATDLHILQAQLDSAATPVAGVTTDIDGTTRDANFPDIGADEVNFLGEDAGITALVAPLSNCTLGAAETVTLRIQNYSAVNLSGFDVAYAVDGGMAVVENIGALTISPGNTADFSFATPVDLSAVGSYTVVAYTSYPDDLNIHNDTLFTVVQHAQTPAAVTAMIPADGAGGLSTTVSFSWSPSVGATLYDLYIWPSGDTQPGTPTVGNINQINYTFNNPGNLLQYGQTYNWRVSAKNAYCATEGPVQTFTLSNLPDLLVNSLTAPASAFSGQQMSVTWEIKNMASGGTGMGQWTDVVYLSIDATLEYNLDIYIGGLSNLTALDADQSYSNTGNFNLPQGLSGTYYVFVIADRFNYIHESDEANNTLIGAATVDIQLTPPPDLQVTAILPPNNPFSGLPATISWTVSNLGTGETRSAGWLDRVYLSADSMETNLSNATYLGARTFSGSLNVNDTYNESLTASLPQGISGTYYLYVATDVYNQEYEHATEGNNTTRSAAFTVFLTPPPDLQVTSVTAPASGSNRETITVSYTVSNEGGNPADGYWIDRVCGSTDPDLVDLSNATELAAVARPYILNPTDTYAKVVNVVLPDGLTGPYYIYVWADAGNNVYEYTFEDNNTHRATNATTLNTPDLAVQGINAPATAQSGDTLSLSWTDQNVGSGKMLDRNWVDRIYISQNSSFSLATATLVGVQAASGTLNGGTGLARNTQVILPSGASGQYYWYVFADAVTQVYENGLEANNVNSPGIALDISLAPYPDLNPTAINTVASAPAGTTISATYTVKNQGAGPASPAWKDKVYLSNSTTWSPNAVQLLRIETVNTSVAEDSSYTRIVQVTLPIDLPSGVYYLFVFTDQENNLYEYTGEDNNRLASGGINVSGYPPVDLAVTNFSGPGASPSGVTVSLSWTVANEATVTTIVSAWSDEVYLSTDAVWQPATDLLLTARQQSGPLPADASYTAARDVTLPNGISGSYYLLLINDPENLHNDLNRSNNEAAIAIAITLTPPPDLAPVDFVVPMQGFSGQPVDISFTIENMGTGSTAPATNWTDRIYLSTDFTLDPGDQILLNIAHSGALDIGASYTDSVQVFLPANSAGNKILILKTDVNNSVYEHTAENNNTAAAAIVVVQPPPSDLVVTQVTVPSTAIAGEEVMLEWTLKNDGANPATGYMKEAVYFSTDSIWDSGDALLGVKAGFINISPQASLSRSFMADLTGVEVGNYYAVVRTDIQNNIAESNEDNNTMVSDSPMTVTVNELFLGMLTPALLDDNRNLYYRLEIPDSLAGESLIVVLKGDSINGANELYLRYGQAPTRASYDFAYGTPLFGNQELIVPAMEAGTYYLLVYGNTTSGNQQNITLLANILNFEIRHVTANKGGNTGDITVKIEGAKFEENMEILLDNQVDTLPGSDLIFISSTQVFVTFHLASGPYIENWQTTGMPVGYYDVVARKPDGQETRLVDGFEVVPGSEPALNISLNYPESARAGNVVVMTLDYSNTGNVDVPVPTFSVVSLFGAPVARSGFDLDLNLHDVPVELIENGGPPGILRPGATGSVTIYSRATTRMRYKLLELE